MEDPAKVTYFGATNTRGKETPFGIKRIDRMRHMYVIGKTGMGKSTLLENMAIQDIRNGEGMAFIDPHGSTADRIMEYVPPHRVKDVLYFAPFDMEYPVAFNVMEDVGYDKRHLVVSGLLSAFRKIWVDAWSARMEYFLSNALLALLEYPDSTLLDVNRLFIDKAFRKKVVDNIGDPIVASFWKDEFANMSDRYTQEATPAIQNKIGQFTSNPLIRNIIGQPKSSFDIRKMMDEKKILIINLSKGRVGEVNATLLGSMLVTKIYLAAMSRADVPASVLNVLPNFYFYVDEFQNFANESFADILSEARKYKLNLLIAHQYVEQMEEEVRNAVFGNVGTTVAFRVGPFDAETLETIFLPQFTKEDLVNLGKAQIYLTLMIDGVGSQPFSATTLPPFDPSPVNLADEVMQSSRMTYGIPRATVEASIAERQKPDTPAASTHNRDERATAPRSAGATASSSRNTNSESGYRAPQRSPGLEPRREAHPQVATAAPVMHATTPVAAAPASPAPSAAPVRPHTPAPVQPVVQQSAHPPIHQSTHPPAQQAHKPEPKREQPAPPGIHSLREAIAMATAAAQKESSSQGAPAAQHKQSQAPTQRSTQTHTNTPSATKPAPDLRAILSTIVPIAPEKQQPAHTPNATHAALSSQQSAPPRHQPHGIPNDQLRNMLAVDGVEE